MKPKTIKVLYWTITPLFMAMMLLDGIGGVTQQQAGQEVMRHLGYPMYALIIFGAAKIAGVIAIIQPKFQTIKEWAYAGFALNFIGAAASRAFSGDSATEIIFPVIMLVFLFIPYFLWKKYESLILRLK